MTDNERVEEIRAQAGRRGRGMTVGMLTPTQAHFLLAQYDALRGENEKLREEKALQTKYGNIVTCPKCGCHHTIY